MGNLCRGWKNPHTEYYDYIDKYQLAIFGAIKENQWFMLPILFLQVSIGDEPYLYYKILH